MAWLQPERLPLIAILRGLTAVEVPMVGRILLDAGYRMLEVPLNRPGAHEAMRALVQFAPKDAVVGAGTVLRIEDVDAVKQAGARLIVSPHCAPAVIRHAVLQGMLALPGVATPTEALAALEAGAQGLKLFPAEMLPPGALQSIKAILPSHTPLFPVGGIHPGNMAAYVAAGAVGFGIGGQLYQPGIDADALKRSAQAFMQAREKLLDGA